MTGQKRAGTFPNALNLYFILSCLVVQFDSSICCFDIFSTIPRHCKYMYVLHFSIFKWKVTYSTLDDRRTRVRPNTQLFYLKSYRPWYHAFFNDFRVLSRIFVVVSNISQKKSRYSNYPLNKRNKNNFQIVRKVSSLNHSLAHDLTSIYESRLRR